MSDVQDIGDPAARRPLLQNSIVRMGAEGSGLVLGTVANMVTARVLGPSSKGTLSALTFVTAIVIQASLMGLGDALVVRVGQAKATIEGALSSSLSAILLSSGAGAAVVFLYSVAQLPVDRPYVWPAKAVACGTVTASCAGQLMYFSVYAKQRMVTASVITVLTGTVSAAALVVLCGVFDLDVLGGALAGITASASLVTACAIVLRQERVKVTLAWDRAYLAPALRFGLRAQFANLLAYSTARVDLLLVYALASTAAAGRYSVALTIGTLTGFVAISLSYASFPGLAALPEDEALRQSAQLARMAGLIAVPLALITAGLAAIVVPRLLGEAYSGSIAPATVLLFGNVLWGQQWLLSRALAARGEPTVLFRSFAANLAAMLVADIVLIPVLGTMGAAVGSVVGPAAGVVVCARAYRKLGVPVRELVPGSSDVAEVRRFLTGVRARFRPE